MIASEKVLSTSTKLSLEKFSSLLSIMIQFVDQLEIQLVVPFWTEERAGLSTLYWMREAEIKHARVCMMAGDRFSFNL